MYFPDKHIYLFCAILLFVSLQVGCKDSGQERSPLDTKQLFSQPQSATSYERVSEALISWKALADVQPTLVLFSNDPFLKPLPDKVKPDLANMLKTASDLELRQAFDHLQSSPLILPEMTLTAALLNNMFREVVWVLSTEPSITTLTPDFFTRQLQQYDAFTNLSLDIRKNQEGFNGQIYETPIRIVAHDNLPEIEGPLLIHIDLSHFSPLYKDEVRTPLFAMLREFAISIETQNWAPLSTSLSASNIDGRMPLASRIMAQVVMQLIHEPKLLYGKLPPTWKNLSLALYQETFFQTESVHNYYRAVAEADPDNAYARYGMFRSLRQEKKPVQALSALAQATSIDPVYAVEYQQLSHQAMQANQYMLAIDMLQLAKRALPNNVFIDVQMAETYVYFGKQKPGLKILQKLKDLQWSANYYERISERLLEWERQLISLDRKPDQEP